MGELVIKFIFSCGVEYGFILMVWVIVVLVFDFLWVCSEGVCVVMFDCGYDFGVVEWVLWLLFGVKILLYVVNMVVLCEVYWCGVDDVIFLFSDGFVLEVLMVLFIFWFGDCFVMLVLNGGILYGMM